METQHTPGPWKVSKLGGQPMIYTDDSKGKQIVNMRDPLVFDDENLANAHLIAAAPGMLEALNVANDALEWAKLNGRMNEYQIKHIYEKQTVICDAIRKAIGE